MAIQQNTRFFQSALRVDYILFTIVAALLAVGLAMVWSVTFAPNVTQGADNPLKEVQSQLLYAAIGMVALIFFSQIDYRFWGRIAVPMILVTVVVLISLFFMPEVNGARRWLMGGSIQPAEFAKLTIIIYMAKWLSSKGEKLRDVTVGLVPFAVIVGIVTGLIVLQPNLSTAIIVGLCAFEMFFIAGADLIQFAFLMIICGGSAVAIVLNTPFQLVRCVQHTVPIGTVENFFERSIQVNRQRRLSNHRDDHRARLGRRRGAWTRRGIFEIRLRARAAHRFDFRVARRRDGLDRHLGDPRVVSRARVSRLSHRGARQRSVRASVGDRVDVLVDLSSVCQHRCCYRDDSVYWRAASIYFVRRFRVDRRAVGGRRVVEHFEQ